MKLLLPDEWLPRRRTTGSGTPSVLPSWARENGARENGRVRMGRVRMGRVQMGRVRMGRVNNNGLVNGAVRD